MRFCMMWRKKLPCRLVRAVSNRFRIDWANLGPLPRKPKDFGATREDLAERKFNMRKAKHKGRCHITNQKRRQMQIEADGLRRVEKAKRDSHYRTYKDMVRDYWLGKRDEHP